MKNDILMRTPEELVDAFKNECSNLKKVFLFAIDKIDTHKLAFPDEIKTQEAVKWYTDNNNLIKSYLNAMEEIVTKKLKANEIK